MKNEHYWILGISLGAIALLYYYKKEKDISTSSSEKKTDESESTQSTSEKKTGDLAMPLEPDEKMTWSKIFLQGGIIFENAKRNKIDPKSLSAKDKCIATMYQYSLDKTAKLNLEKGTPDEALQKCIESVK